MEISDLPNELRELLDRLGHVEPKMCFMNCYLAVMNTLSKKEYDLNYVLGTVKYNGYSFDHALLRWKGNYYDPTLEPQGLHRISEYSIEREFTSQEIVDLMVAKFGIAHCKEMIEGKAPFWPLQRVAPNEYEFVNA